MEDDDDDINQLCVASSRVSGQGWDECPVNEHCTGCKCKFVESTIQHLEHFHHRYTVLLRQDYCLCLCG